MTTIPLMKTPRSIDVEITNGCNLRCRYCSHFSSPGDVGMDLSTEEWLKFFDELGTCGVMNMAILGGEPFCREDLPELIEGIVRNRMRFEILSNGTLLTKDMARFLADTGRCNYVQISIDGAKPATHDSFRGAGTFEKACNAVRMLKEAGVRPGCRVTVHRRNFNELEEIARFLLEDLQLGGFSTNYVSYLGMSRENADLVCLTIDERVKAMETLVALTRKYPGRIAAAAGPLADARQYWAMEEAYRSGKKEIEGRGFLVGCNCPWQKIAVRADGGIVPCNHLGHMLLGRINQDSLLDIWQNSEKLNQFRNRRYIPLSHFEYCRECNYQMYCTGNCPATGYSMEGTEYMPSPESCMRKFLEQGGRIIPV